MHQKLAELLCHDSDEQIQADDKSNDPILASAAQMVLQDPQSFEYYKKEYRKPNKQNGGDVQ
jgi:hypothetical protein